MEPISARVALRAFAILLAGAAVWLATTGTEQDGSAGRLLSESLGSRPALPDDVPSVPVSGPADEASRLPVALVDDDDHVSTGDGVLPPPPIQPLEITVTVEATGVPAVGARVEVSLRYGDAETEPQVSVTDESGRAWITPLTRDSLRVDARLGELCGSRPWVRPGQSITVVLRGCVETTVRVEDEAGQGVEGARVIFFESAQYATAGTTDAEGFTPRLHLPAADVTAHVVGRDFARLEIALPRGGVPDPWRIVVRRQRIEVTGVVLHAGTPVEDALVYDHRASHRSTETGPDGHFRLGRYDEGDLVLLRVVHPRFEPHTHPFTVTEESAEVRVELRSGSTLTVRVLDAAGRPIPGADVRATWTTGWAPEPSASDHTFTNYRSGETDERGECALMGMPDGARYELRAEHPAYNRAEESSTEQELLVLRLEPRTDFPVRVLLGSEVERFLDVEGWLVTLQRNWGPRRQSGPTRQATTDRRGMAVLSGLPLGKYFVHLSAPRGLWSEWGRQELGGESWDHSGPTVAVRLVPEPGLPDALTLEGHGYESRFVEEGGSRVAAARPGEAKLRSADGVRRVSIQESIGVQWIRFSSLATDEPGAGASGD